MNQYIDDLLEIGLTVYEAKTYFSLLRKNSFTANELSRISKIPRTKVYEILNKLMDNGLCTEIPGRTRKFKAVNPDTAFKKIVADLDTKKDNIEKVTKSLLPIFLNNNHKNAPLDYIEIIREENSLMERLNQLIEQSESDILSLKKPPYDFDTRKIIEGDLSRHNSNVKHKYVFEIDKDVDQEFLNLLEIFASEGAEIKVLPKVPIRMVLFDRKILNLTLEDNISNETSYTNMIIQQEELSAIFEHVFLTNERRAEPLKRFIRKIK